MKTRIAIWSLLVLGMLLLVGSVQTTHAQRQLALSSESKLWIDGTSTVNAFTCSSKAPEGYGVLKSDANRALQASTASVESSTLAELVVPVESFDCGKSRMNRDFYDALKADAHPLIRYELEYADVVSRPEDENGFYQLRAVGRIIIAGAERTVTTTLLAQRSDDGRYHVEGSQQLLMSTFGIDPPTALLGLVRAHDRIEVHFDLVAESIASQTISSTTNATQ